MLGTKLIIEDYHTQYANIKRAEYWFGEVRFKEVPTWLHSLLQGLLVQVFTDAGYASGSELDLRIDPEWEPKPDVVAASVIEQPYPTKPIDIAAEILSPTDSLDGVKVKCAQYKRIGIHRIFVFDPASKTGFEWQDGHLEEIDELRFDNGAQQVVLRDLWKELDRRLALGRPSA